MISGYSPIIQAVLGTFFTWGVTALGASIVFFPEFGSQKRQQKYLDFWLGFASGVRTNS